MKTLNDYLEMNTLSELTNVGLVDRVVEFIRANPFPKDHEQLHKWAKKMGYDESEDIEEYCYAMLTLILCGGKSKGKEIKVKNDKNKLIGDQIELEHVSYETTNPVLQRMQMVLQQKIRNDHLAEDENYYVDGANFIKELKKEIKK